MKSNPLKEYTQELQKSPSLCNWSKLFSCWTWERINFCRTIIQMEVFETSLTQELIYQFWQLAQSTHMPLEIYQSKDEKANGSDLEICVQTPKGYFIIPCQAKIADKKSKYRNIAHKVKGKYQIDLLLAYGAKVRGLPMYLLYNFHDEDSKNQQLEIQHKVKIQELGCTLCPAEKLKKSYWNPHKNKVTIPGFYDLHTTISLPFSKLLCSVGTTKFLEETETPLSHIDLYTEKYLTNRDQWLSLVPFGAIGKLELPREPEIEQPILEEQPKSYNPKFRILLSIEKRTSQLISN